MRNRMAVGLVALFALTACDAVPDRTVDQTISCQAGSITGQGSSAQANAVNVWIRNYQVACAGATIAYTSSGSGAGVAQFSKRTGDFAGSDSPLSAADRSSVSKRCGASGPVHLPMTVGPIALAYNVPGASDLQLSPATIARIFTGEVSTWNSPLIVKDNPHSNLPAIAIKAVHRSDRSGTTDNFTGFLAAAGPDWTFGNRSLWPLPAGIAAVGNDAVATAIEQTEGSIGYVEASYARFHELPTARVGNAAAQFVSLTDVAAGVTVAGATVSGSGDLQLAFDYAKAISGAYPIVQVTYEIICPEGVEPLAKSFLAYASSPAGQRAATDAGFAPLPENLRVKVAAAVASLH